LNPIQLLLNSVIDYAGLFPPASMSMAQAAADYADYRTGEFSWALGRFVIPVSRLTELEPYIEKLPQRQTIGWRLSALGSFDVKSDLREINDFNRRHVARVGPGSQSAMIDTIELKADSVEAIDWYLEAIPDRFQTYVEIPVAGDARALIDAVGARGGRAKVRAGGVTPEVFPTPAQLAVFVLLCVDAGIRFKATAGLHHALRSMHPLTYEPSAPSGMMHGFLNVLIASAFAYAGADAAAIEAILEEKTIEAFKFESAGVQWRNLRVSSLQMRTMRERLFESFGSCSFEEPTSEMKALGLL